MIYISLSPDVLRGAIDNTRGNTPMAVMVTSPFDMEMFQLGEKVSAERENWLVGVTSHGYQVRVAVPKDFVLKGTSSPLPTVGMALRWMFGLAAIPRLLEP